MNKGALHTSTQSSYSLISLFWATYYSFMGSILFNSMIPSRWLTTPPMEFNIAKGYPLTGMYLAGPEPATARL